LIFNSDKISDKGFASDEKKGARTNNFSKVFSGI